MASIDVVINPGGAEDGARRVKAALDEVKRAAIGTTEFTDRLENLYRTGFVRLEGRLGAIHAGTSRMTEDFRRFGAAAVMEVNRSSDALSLLHENWVKISIAVYVAKQAFQQAFAMADAGARMQETTARLEQQLQGTGVQAQRLTADLKIATANQLSFAAAADLASKGLAAEMSPTHIKSFAALAEAIGDLRGGTIEENFDAITRGILGGRSEALKAIGIFVDLDKAIDDFAATTGRDVASISEAEKAQIRLNSVMRQTPEILRQFGGSLSQSDKLTALKADLEDIASSALKATANVAIFLKEATIDPLVEGLTPSRATGGPIGRIKQLLGFLAERRSGSEPGAELGRQLAADMEEALGRATVLQTKQAVAARDVAAALAEEAKGWKIVVAAITAYNKQEAEKRAEVSLGNTQVDIARRQFQLFKPFENEATRVGYLSAVLRKIPIEDYIASLKAEQKVGEDVTAMLIRQQQPLTELAKRSAAAAISNQLYGDTMQHLAGDAKSVETAIVGLIVAGIDPADQRIQALSTVLQNLRERLAEGKAQEAAGIAIRERAIAVYGGQIQAELALTREQLTTLGMVGEARRVELAVIQQKHTLQQRGVDLNQQEIDKLRGLFTELDRNREELQQADSWRRVFDSFDQALDRSVLGVIQGTNTMKRAFNDFWLSLAAQFTSDSLQRLFKPLKDWLGDQVVALMAGRAGGSGGIFGGIGQTTLMGGTGGSFTAITPGSGELLKNPTPASNTILGNSPMVAGAATLAVAGSLYAASQRANDSGQRTAHLAGTAAGAAIGAFLGTFAFPGVGTLAGAGIGAVGGGALPQPNFNNQAMNALGGAMAGGMIGAGLGQMFLPIPGLGALVGGLLGEALGGFIGSQFGGDAGRADRARNEQDFLNPMRDYYKQLAQNLPNIVSTPAQLAALLMNQRQASGVEAGIAGGFFRTGWGRINPTLAGAALSGNADEVGRMLMASAGGFNAGFRSLGNFQILDPSGPIAALAEAINKSVQVVITAMRTANNELNAALDDITRQTIGLTAPTLSQAAAVASDFSAQRAHINRNVQQQIDDVRSLMALQTSPQDVRTSMQTIRTLLQQRYEGEVELVKSWSQKMQMAVDAWRALGQTVDTQLETLRYGDFSLTTPQARLSRQQELFDAAAAAFRSSPSAEAGARVSDLANPLLNAATAIFDRPSSQFQALLSTVIGTLEEVQGQALAQEASFNEAMLAALGAGNTLDSLIEQNTKTMADSLEALRDEVAAMLRGFGFQVPSFQEGTDSVPYTGLYRLHHREAVLNEEEADEWRSGRGGVSVSLTIAPGAFVIQGAGDPQATAVAIEDRLEQSIRTGKLGVVIKERVKRG